MSKKKLEETRLHTLEKGSPFHEKNRVVGKLAVKEIQYVYRAIDLMKEFVPKSVIAEMLETETGISQTYFLSNYIPLASKIITEEYLKKGDELIGLHLSRYNKDINSILLRDYKKYDEDARERKKTYDFFNLLDILSQKEKLLGLHNKNFTVKIFQQNNLTINQKTKTNKYNLDKLSLHEKIELLELISLTKQNREVGIIKMSREVEKEKIEEAVVVVEETNVEKIEIVKEATIDSLPPPTLLTIQEKIRLKLEEVAREEFKKAGSKTV